MNTFFWIIITGESDAKDWAKRYWDTYGFDYDLERTGGDTVFAWPYNDFSDVDEAKSAAMLEGELDAAGIAYETQRLSLDSVFGQL